MIVKEIEKLIQGALKELDLPAEIIKLEHPADLANGDYSTNIALILAKKVNENPRAIAETLRLALMKNKELAQGEKLLSKIEVAGAGFINFYLSPKFFAESLKEISEKGNDFGANKNLAGKKIMVDYTDPNPFKEFHIGHLMSNAIGESICRILESNGAPVVRICYQGDVGLHVAKALWGMLQNKAEMPSDSAPLSEKIVFLGASYVLGSQKYESDLKATCEIKEINKKIFEKSDPATNALYEKGRTWSMLHFDEIYKKLSTRFNHIIPESSVIDDGEKIVEEFLAKGVFEKSEGAVVFPGEKYGLHTRVFITSEGLPTYETKDMGLAKKKIELEKNLGASIIITANEQNDYFGVVFRALGFIFPDYAKISKHIGHGMLRFATGKMSSRTGNVITGESLIEKMENLVFEKIKEREFSDKERFDVAKKVAIGAIKFSILRSATGSDVIFDFEKSISFGGDSGPYLQYSYARAVSVLRKAEDIGIEVQPQFRKEVEPQEMTTLERLLYRFPEIVERAADEYEPHYIVTYLTELAGAFNNFYAHNPILDAGEATPYRLALTKAFTIVMKNGLTLLAIPVLERM